MLHLKFLRIKVVTSSAFFTEMDKTHWMELSIATGKSLETMELSSAVPSPGLFQNKDITDVEHAHLACAMHLSQHSTFQCLAPACAPRNQEYPLTPLLQPDSFDGSLNDMLLPYQYAKQLDDLLSEQDEPLPQQLVPIAQFEKSPLCQRNMLPFSSGDSIILNEDAVSANDDKELACAISKTHQDAKNAQVVPTLHPITPMPAPTRRRPSMRKGTILYRENHILTERQRRQDMTSLFQRLKSVLPGMQQDNLKDDRCKILDHVIDYVQDIDKKLQAFQKVKEVMMQGKADAIELHCRRRLAQQDALSFVESISVHSYGHVDIFIKLKCPKYQGSWPNLLAILENTLQLDVQNVALCSAQLFWSHSIYAKVVSNDMEEVCFKVKKTLREFMLDHAFKSTI